MKLHDSVRVVRMRCGIHIGLVLRFFDDPEDLSSRDFLVGVVPELSSWLTV
jgi:hypothetical protein